MRHDPKTVAEGAMNRLCEGAVVPTARNLLAFNAHLLRIAVVRGATRAWNQRSLVR
jgi:hypothetical protein